MKKLTLVFNHFEEEHLSKDVFLVPYYIGKKYDMNVTIVFPKTETNKNLPAKIRGVKLHPLKSLKKESKFIYRIIIFSLYIVRNIRNIDVLMLIHIMHESALIGSLYKLFKSNGFLYIKGDDIGMANANIEQQVINSRKIKDKFVCRLFTHFLKRVDLITVETDDGYNRLYNNKIFGVDLQYKVQQMYNGFDEDKLSEYGIEVNEIAQKNNIILTVSRLGSFQKNTEMLLNAAKELHWKDWKMILIGPIEVKENNFQQKIDDFFISNPHLKNRVLFLGTIYDKNELWEWFNKSKVFVLPSRFEGFANVFAEAVRFNNYIVSTDIGGAKEMIREGCGEIVQQEDCIGLSQVLQKIIDGNTILENMFNHKNTDISWEKCVEDAIKL
jgi:glycosyltransferase involved in cell wall biosynthesis